MEKRDFLKYAGAGAIAIGAFAATGCRIKKNTVAVPEPSDGIPCRTNPVNGDKTSLLGFGCMRWPMVKGEDGKDHIDQEAVNEMVDYALEHGINYYDTSPAYLQGQSEMAAGIALSRHPRDSYFIATKLSNFSDSSFEASKKMYLDSFRDLRTDYIDYYLLHSIGRSGNRSYQARYVDNGILPFLLEEKAAGRIRNLGFSFHGPQDQFDYFMELFDKGEVRWDFVQIEMNYVDWNHADGRRNVNASYFYAQLEKRGIPIMVMEPLLGGRLAKVPANISRALHEREPEKSVASWAFRFVGSFPGVQTILSGMTSMDPLIENVETFGKFIPLSEDEIALMEKLATEMKEYPLVNCTDCKYCMPCPYGIDIPGVFKHYNTSITEGTYVQSRDQKNYRKIRNRYLTSYNKAVPSVRQADHCIACGTCLPHCPQSIAIPGELRRIARYIEKLKQETL